MKVICVDDEKKIMEYTTNLCRRLPVISEAAGFVSAKAALNWLEDHEADLALLDIDMPEMNGIQLAARIKERRPHMAVIFLTAFPQYALDAFSVHASGYLIKPVIKEKLEQEICYALEAKLPEADGHVMIKTFGGFDIFVDGKLVTFRQAKCKELLAYLVDRGGNSATRAEVFAVLWEDRLYDRSMQKQLDAIIRSMRTTLKEFGIEKIFELKNGTLRILPETFTCDSYRFFDGDAAAVNSYRGEYMTSYSWASLTESFMSTKALRYSAGNGGKTSETG